MKTIAVNGIDYDFPDSMSYEEIKTVLRKKLNDLSSSQNWKEQSKSSRDTVLRGVVRTAAFPVTAAGDIVYGVGNYLTGSKLEAPFGAAALESRLKSAGLPPSKLAANRVVEEGIVGGGLGGALGKAAGVIPGITSSVAMKSAEEAGAPPAVQLGAAVLGGIAPGVVTSVAKGGATAARGAMANQTRENLDTISTKLFRDAGAKIETLRQSGVAISDLSIKKILEGLKNSADVIQVTKDIRAAYPETAAALGNVASKIKNTGVNDIAALHEVRKLISGALNQASKPEDVKRLASMLNYYDEALAGLSKKDFIFGADVGEDVIKQLQQTLADYKNAGNYDAVAEVIAKAAGDKTKLIAAMKKFQNTSRFKMLTPTQQELVKKASNTTLAEVPLNLLGALGVDVRKVAETGQLPLLSLGGPAGVTLASSNPLLTVGTVGAGTATKELSRALRKGKAQDILNAIKNNTGK